MTYRIQRAAVIGAGTMGAAIAAHLANAGVPVYLLDIAPNKLTEKEEAAGLTLEHPKVRNRIVKEGFERMSKARPASFVSPDRSRLITIGNLEDNFDWIGEADWVLEAIIEKLEPKQQLMARIEATRKPTSIVSTNTSGIPIASIAAGRSDEFRKHFMGTHFFNPPRYLKLLEVIPTADTDPASVEFISRFAEQRLGKGVVICKDTPNFIANRLASVSGAFMLDYILKHEYTVEEVDRITGPLIGRPKSASFRLYDLVGFDVAMFVRENLYDLIPDDESREYLRSPRVEALSKQMFERGWLGNKSGQGFYKTIRQNGKKEYWPLNLETMEYEAPTKPRFESMGKAKDVEPLGKRVRMLLEADDRAAQLVRALTWNGLAYASRRVPEIADDIVALDRTIRWGFMNDAGPFELWDGIGVAETVAMMEADGVEVADWVKEMLAGGHATFYQYEGERATGYYDLATKAYKPIDTDADRNVIILKDMKASGKVIKHNLGASVIDLGDGVAALEFHTKLNALDQDILEMAEFALSKVDQDFEGLVIGNNADNFCVGANIFAIAVAAQNQDWDQIEQGIRALQDLMMRTRYFHKPVVAAPTGMALGGGAEVVMGASRVVAASETYIGLVEVGVGLIPGGGGCKEMVRRVIGPPLQTKNANVLPYMQRLFETIGQAKVGTSAAESRTLGFLSDTDRIVMNRGHVLAEAKREVLAMAAAGYTAPIPPKLYAAGRDALAALHVGLYMFQEGAYISEYDAHVGRKLARVLSGGEISQPTWVDEQHFLDLEREAFVSLCGEEKTLERIWHMLQKGKPLRN